MIVWLRMSDFVWLRMSQSCDHECRRHKTANVQPRLRRCGQYFGMSRFFLMTFFPEFLGTREFPGEHVFPNFHPAVLVTSGISDVPFFQDNMFFTNFLACSNRRVCRKVSDALKCIVWPTFGAKCQFKLLSYFNCSYFINSNGGGNWKKLEGFSLLITKARRQRMLKLCVPHPSQHAYMRTHTNPKHQQPNRQRQHWEKNDNPHVSRNSLNYEPNFNNNQSTNGPLGCC